MSARTALDKSATLTLQSGLLAIAVGLWQRDRNSRALRPFSCHGLYRTTTRANCFNCISVLAPVQTAAAVTRSPLVFMVITTRAYCNACTACTAALGDDPTKQPRTTNGMRRLSANTWRSYGVYDLSSLTFCVRSKPIRAVPHARLPTFNAAC